MWNFPPDNPSFRACISHMTEDPVQILNAVKTVAMVGASPRANRPSYDVLGWMKDRGYDMIPINPNPDVTEIHGLPVVRSLAEVDRPIDMVQVFRQPEHLYGIAQEAIDVGAKVLWGQLGVVDEVAADLARRAGLQVVMNRCPKIELAR